MSSDSTGLVKVPLLKITAVEFATVVLVLLLTVLLVEVELDVMFVFVGFDVAAGCKRRLDVAGNRYVRAPAHPSYHTYC